MCIVIALYIYNLFSLTVSSDMSLTLSDLHEILCTLWCIRYMWYQLGLALGVDITTLEVIKRDNPYSTDDCFRSVIVTWLRQSKAMPTWRSLTEVLKSLEIKVDYQIVATDSVT